MNELSGLPESVRKLALDRFRLLRPHLEQNQPLRQVALEAGIPYRTAQRWLTRYKQFGLALARKKRADKGVRRGRDIVERDSARVNPCPKVCFASLLRWGTEPEGWYVDLPYARSFLSISRASFQLARFSVVGRRIF